MGHRRRHEIVTLADHDAGQMLREGLHNFGLPRAGFGRRPASL